MYSFMRQEQQTLTATLDFDATTTLEIDGVATKLPGHGQLVATRSFVNFFDDMKPRNLFLGSVPSSLDVRLFVDDRLYAVVLPQKDGETGCQIVRIGDGKSVVRLAKERMVFAY